MSGIHICEAARIWRHLGCEDGCGKIGISDIIGNSRYLSRVFPELLDRYASVAEKGAVSFGAFQALYLGKPVASGHARTKNGPPGRFSTADVRVIFDTIDQDGSGDITLAELVAMQDYVVEKVPEMLTHWAEIDVSDSGTITFEEFSAFFGDVDVWLEFQLGAIVGLEDLKDQIRRFYRGVVLDQLRRQHGHSVGNEGCKYHMIFQGPPGTGKTSLARLMARLLHRVGIAPRENLVEVQQEQLVAGFCGQTAPKTQKVIEESAGGVLFIDEAYRLSQGTGSNDFGKEAIEQLMSSMNDSPSTAPIMIFAGYPADMQQFMSQNSGLYRRIPYTFNFSNYSCSELAEIFECFIAKKGFSLERRLSENGRQDLAGILERNTLPQARGLMNGGLCERLFSLAKEALDLRDDPMSPSVVLSSSDILFACKRLPPPPGAKSPRGSSVIDESSELHCLREQMSQLQAENVKLHEEIEGLRSQAQQGSDADVLNATMIQNPNLNDTCVAEMRGIQELLKEVRRLRAELQGRDRRLEEMESDNAELTERLREAEELASSSRFAPGTPVQYFSGSLHRWIDATVVAWDAGKYDLDVKKGVAPDKVRRRGLDGGC